MNYHFLSKKTKYFFSVIIILMLMISPLFGQAKKLTHRMSAQEKAMMPSYLISAAKGTAAPPYPVRSIAEFEPMEGVLIAYPFGIPITLIKEMALEVKVYTIVASSSEQTTVTNTYNSNGVNLANCSFIIAPHDSYWTRDYGPQFVTDGNNKISIVDVTYNRPRPNDDIIPQAVATFLGVDFYKVDLNTTGGNYMSDGKGYASSTSLILEENTSLTQAQINSLMYDYYGIQTYYLPADPTGTYIDHIDCWAKYLSVDKILIGKVASSSSQYTEYETLATWYANQTTGYGNKYKVYRVNTPNSEPYTNSVILNKKVLIPYMGTTNDSGALQSYQTAMPGYTVKGFINTSSSIAWQSTDALHCRVIGIADRGMLYIKHMPLLGNQPQQTQYTVSADIIPYSGQPVTSGSTKLYYKVGSGAYYTVDMTLSSGNTYTATIPSQVLGSQISYYIAAADNSGRTNTHPYIGSYDPHVFTVGSSTPAPVAAFTANTTMTNIGGTVQFTDQSTNTPTSWSWTFAGGTPSTSTAQNPSVTYNTAGNYTVTLTVTNASGSNTLSKTDYISVSTPSVTYCACSSSNYSSEWIASVKIGSMTNTSAGSGYSDFTSKIASMTRSASVSLTLTPGFSGTSYTEYWKVWIDYNKDGDFADSGENVYSGSGKTAKTGSFTVPSTASTGTTRIRVSMKYGSAPSYCTSFTYGEVEDYTASIQ